MNKENLTISLCQYDIHWNDPLANFATIEELTSGLNYDLLVLPEMFSTGFITQPNDGMDPLGIKSKKWMESMSTNSMLLGSISIKEKDLFYNKLLVYASNNLINNYSKSHTFIGTETTNYSNKKEPVTVHQKGWSIGLNICYDLRFPVWNRLYAGNDILVYCANWPKSRIEHWKTLLKARAIENQCYVIGVNRIGVDGNDWEYTGHSMVVDYKGDVLLDAQNKEEAFILELDKQALLEYRNDFPFLEDKDLFQFL